MSSTNPFVDIYTLLESDHDPPTPLLSALLLRAAKRPASQPLQLYERLIKEIDAKDKKFLEDSKKLAHILNCMADTHAKSGDKNRAVVFYRRVLSLFQGQDGGIIVEEGGEAAPTIGINNDEDRRVVAEATSALARVLENSEESFALYMDALRLCDEQSELAADCAFSLASLHQLGFGLRASSASITQKGNDGNGIETEENRDNPKEEIKKKAVIEMLQKSLEIEEAVNGSCHFRTEQVRRRLEEIQNPLTWSSPPKRTNDESMLDCLLAGKYIPELAEIQRKSRKDERIEGEIRLDHKVNGGEDAEVSREEQRKSSDGNMN